VKPKHCASPGTVSCGGVQTQAPADHGVGSLTTVYRLPDKVSGILLSYILLAACGGIKSERNKSVQGGTSHFKGDRKGAPLLYTEKPLARPYMVEMKFAPSSDLSPDQPKVDAERGRSGKGLHSLDSCLFYATR
jgi:hypothetical protein